MSNPLRPDRGNNPSSPPEDPGTNLTRISTPPYTRGINNLARSVFQSIPNPLSGRKGTAEDSFVESNKPAKNSKIDPRVDLEAKLLQFEKSAPSEEKEGRKAFSKAVLKFYGNHTPTH